jgi:predicted AAA+ superfamily ATPase
VSSAGNPFPCKQLSKTLEEKLANWELIPNLYGMIDRFYRGLVVGKLDRYPAVSLLGPRQCGKTTLAKNLGGRYFDMESEGAFLRLDAEWDRLMRGEELVVIDEAQCAPEIFPRLRGAIDSDRKRNGRFLLLGSVSPALMQNVSESLAGRMGLVSMGPLTYSELAEPLGTDCVESLWLRGGFPDGGILDASRFSEWQKDYLELLATRDLPEWGFPAKPQHTRRLLSMLAAVNAQPLNASNLAAALGIDHKTVMGYCDFLEETFLIRRVRPWSGNISKRLVKTPRLYWRDSGLLHALLNVQNIEHLYSQPWVGHSWEGFVIEQILTTLGLLGLSAEPYFFRTSDGTESDLVLDWAGKLWAIEIKMTSDPTRTMIQGLQKAADLMGASRRILLCKTVDEIRSEELLVTNLPLFLQELARMSKGEK